MRTLTSPRFHAAAWMFLVGIGMLLPGDALPPIGSWLPASLEAWLDKIEHFIAFFIMTILVWRVLSPAGTTRRPVLASAAWTLGYALLLEALQIPHPSRFWAPADLLADVLGVAVGVVIVISVSRPR